MYCEEYIELNGTDTFAFERDSDIKSTKLAAKTSLLPAAPHPRRSSVAAACEPLRLRVRTISSFHLYSSTTMLHSIRISRR